MKPIQKMTSCALACALAVSSFLGMPALAEGTFLGMPALTAGTLRDKTGTIPYAESRISEFADEYTLDVYYSGKVYYDGEYETDMVVEQASYKKYVKNSTSGEGDYIFWQDLSGTASTGYYIATATKMAFVTNMYSLETIPFPSSYQVEIYSGGEVTCGTTTVDDTEYYSETVTYYQSETLTVTVIYCFEKGTTNLLCVVDKTAWPDGREVVTTYQLDELRHSSTTDWNTLLPDGFPSGYTVN